MLKGKSGVKQKAKPNLKVSEYLVCTYVYKTFSWSLNLENV